MAIINGTDESDYLELDQDGITVNDIYNDGSINNNTINAGDGDDLIINSSSENNTLNGGDGDDLISNPESNNNIINGGSGDDYVSNSGSNNIVNGDSGNDDLIILKGNDNIINGGDGNDDFKIAGGNNNTLIGNTEIDTFTFYYDVYDSSSIIEDFNASEEKINFSAYFDGFFETDAEKPRFSDLNISQSGSDTIISLFETSYFKEIIITLKNINQSDITADNFIGLNDNQENTAPDANDDYVAIIKSTSFSDDVLFNDTDADNDTLTVTQVNGQESNVGSQITLNSGALLTVNSNGTYDYDPNNQFNYLNSDDYEMDSFSYEISDGKGGFDTANVRITINGEGGFSNPIAVDDEIITPLTSSASGNLLDNDFSDDHDEYNKAYFISKINGEASNVGTEITLPSGALLTVYAQGDFDYNPNGQFIAPETSSDSFTYEISEYDGGIDTATVTITFYDDELVNEYFPIANNDFETITESAPISGNVLFNDTDGDNDVLSISKINGESENVGSQIKLTSGALLTVNSDGTFDYNPNGQFDYLADGQSTTDSFYYEASDGKAGRDNATVFIEINGQGEVPRPYAYDDYEITTESSNFVGNVMNNDIDLDFIPKMSVSKVNGDSSNVDTQIILASGALLTVNSDGTFDYNPNGQFDYLNYDEYRQDEFEYEITNFYGGTDTATVIIGIEGLSTMNIINGTDTQDNLFGDAGDDVINAFTGNDRINGRDGRDTIHGGEGDDFIVGDDGHDTLNGDDGNDELQGRNGSDTLNGGDGDDTLLGGDSYDYLYGNNGNDTINGGKDYDYINGGDDDDDIIGGHGGDELFGDNGNDTLRGDEGDDYLSGGDGNDILSGNSGNDTLYGDDGNDVIHGNSGQDIIFGGLGSDELYGDSVANQQYNPDTFLYFSNQDSIMGSSDIINQFVVGSDKIDVQALGITAANLVINNAGGSLFEVSKAGSTDLFLEVSVFGTKQLQASDFVLAA